MLAAIFERDFGTSDQVLDGAGNKHLSRSSQGRNAGSYVDSDAADLAFDDFAFASVKSHTKLNAELSDGLPDSARAADGPRRTVEGGEEAIAGGVGLAA